MNGLKWTRKTGKKIASELAKLYIVVSETTIRKLLNKMSIKLRVNKKIISCGAKYDDTKRDNQFKRIAKFRKRFAKEKNPIISVDAKKSELIGNFKNPGATWRKKAHAVNDHDYATMAKGKIIPYGVYDVTQNTGSIFVGISKGTAAFAIDAIKKWWRNEGRKKYKRKKQLLILADGGGGNGASVRAWKYHIQKELSDKYRLEVTVCHYPPGTSKWNPIEHRLFSEISKNWAGEPLESFEKALNYIRNTKTATGLSVKAWLVKKSYKLGEKISKQDFAKINLQRNKKEPKLVYTISPS